MAEKAHSSVVIFETVQLWFLTVQLWFLRQFSCDFSQFSCDFWNSSVVIFRLDERDWNLTYGNWDRGVFFSRHFGRRQSCSLVCVWQCLAFKTMDAIIRQTVREEIRRQGESASTSSEAATRSQKFLIQFVRRRVGETGSVLKLCQNLPQLKNWRKKPLLCFSLTGKVFSLALLTTCS